jgi:PKHD-type hydroxylase
MIENTKFVRKLTVIAPINRKDEYEGGVFELMNMPPINLDRGDIIVFPSNLVHRVTPVTKGIRKSATIWINGIKSW